MAPPLGQDKRQPPVKPIPRVDDPAKGWPGGMVNLPGSNLPLPMAHSFFGNNFLNRYFQGWAANLPTPADGFKKEFENQVIPNEVKGRVEVAAPSLSGSVPVKPVTLAFDVPVKPVETQEPATLYAIPESELFESEAAAMLPPGEERDKQSLLILGSPRIPDLSKPAPDVKAPAVTTSQKAPAPPSATGPKRLYTRMGPVEVIARSAGFGITGEFHKLAVGAASTTVLDTPRGLMIIDAGIAGGPAGPLADATLAKLHRIVKGRAVVDLLSTHAHLDHTILFKRIFAEFEVRGLHMNLAQAMQPGFKSDPKTKGATFDEFKGELFRAQRQFLETKLRQEVEATRADWEKAHDVPEAGAREAQWRQYVEEQVAARMAARQVLSVDLQVPGAGGEMRVVSAPIDKVDISKVEFAPGETVGVVQGSQQSAIVNKNLADAIERQKAGGGKKDVIDVDRYATAYVLIVDAKILALVLPDLRVNDIVSIRKALKAEMTRLGHTAELRVWDIGHHLQAGFLGATADAKAKVTLPQARASQLVKLTELLSEFANVKNAVGAQPTDVVSVSARASLIDPAVAVLLKSMGYEIVPALKGQDVRLIEAVTATGRRVKGLAGGQPLAVGGPGDPLLRRAHAAVEELEQKADTLERQARKLRKKSDQAEKERLKTEATEARTKAGTIRTKVKDYVQRVNDQLTDAAGKPRPAPAAGTGPAEPAAAEAAALRAELVAFDRPVVGRLGTFSDVAVVILGGDIPAEARAELRALEEVRQLESQLAGEKAATAPPEVRARYAAALEQKRNIVRRRLADANKQGPEAAEERKVLRDELKVLDGEVEAALRASGATGQTADVFKRRLPNGKLVETRVEVPKRPSAFTRGVQSGADLFGRGLGAVMVYQLVKGEAELEERYQKGEANLLEFAAGTAHNVYGMTIGARMVGAVHVGPGEFVILAALDIAQTAFRDYDTTAQRNTAIAYSVIRNALSLGLMTVGQFLIQTGHPVGIIVGLGVMFLADPILEKLGVYEWLERKFEFLPDEVVAVTQKLRKLMDEYRVIVGALEIAKRDDQQLTSVGAKVPEDARKAARAIIASRREDARRKESELLTAFLLGYKEAKDSYGGLPELDQYRAEFLKLMIQAQGEEAPRKKSDEELGDIGLRVVGEAWGFGDTEGLTTRERADAIFWGIEKSMSLEKMSSEQVAEMSQWKKMDDWMDKVRGELAGTEPEKIDWKWLAEKVGELDQMFNSARYRLRPGDYGAERTVPLLPEKSTARYFYEQELMKREKRFLYLRESLAESAAGKEHPAQPGALDKLAAKLNPWAHAFPSSEPDVYPVTLEATLASAEAAIAAYRKAIDQQPALGNNLTAEGVARHSWEAGTAYPIFVNNNDAYKSGLFRMKTLELAMRTSVGQALTLGQDGSVTATDDQRHRLQRLPIEARKVSELRSEEKGFLFLDEAQGRIPAIRAKENVQLASLLGQPKDVSPLTPYEQDAATKGDLEDMNLTTITNRLARIAQLRFPTPEEVKQGKTNVEGIYKVVGEYDYTDLFVVRFGGTEVEDSDNVLVGFVREGGETTSGQYGHASMWFVTPLNAAAVNLFGGTGEKRLLRNLLNPATVDDIRKLKP